MRFVLVAVLLASGVAGACNSSESRQGAAAVEVVVQDNIFTPQTLRIRAGTEVVFRNQGFSPHRLAPAEPDRNFGRGPFGVVSDQFRQGARYSYRFDRTGEFRYYCTIHGLPDDRMHGSVIVTA